MKKVKNKQCLNNKGFTLIEVLCVITIISLLSVFAVPNFIKLMNDNKQSISDIQNKMIIDASKLYFEDCDTLNTDLTCNIKKENNKTIITLEELVTNGYIDEVKVNDKICEGNIIKEQNKYTIDLNC